MSKLKETKPKKKIFKPIRFEQSPPKVFKVGINVCGSSETFVVTAHDFKITGDAVSFYLCNTSEPKLVAVFKYVVFLVVTEEKIVPCLGDELPINIGQLTES